MRSSILLLVLSATVLGSCTSAYKTGQTPDDVYFSPERQHDEYVNVKENDDSRYYGSNDEYYDDQYLRMKVHNRLIWSELDDYYYSPGYSYGYYNSWNWNNPWSPSSYWNYYYNPYCSPVIITSKANLVYSHPRIFNLNTYNNNQITNNNYTRPKGGGIYNSDYNNNSYNRPVRMVGVNNSNNNGSSGTGNFLRNIFNGSSNNNNNSSSNSSYSNQGRSSGSSSSSSGSSGSSSAPVRRF